MKITGTSTRVWTPRCNIRIFDEIGNHGNNVRERGERLGQGLGFGAQGLCGGARRALSFSPRKPFASPFPSVRFLRASHHGEVLEAQQGRGALARPLCRPQGCHREELWRWHQGTPLRSCYRLRHRQVPPQGLPLDFSLALNHFSDFFASLLISFTSVSCHIT